MLGFGIGIYIKYIWERVFVNEYKIVLYCGGWSVEWSLDSDQYD